MSEKCPCCGENGEQHGDLWGSDLLACMNLSCRVNEFSTRE